jgi:hypothetical protein
MVVTQGYGRQSSPAWYWFSWLGTVESMKPYGAFIDIDGINGLFHVSQISHDRVADISIVLQPGHNLKVLAIMTRLKVVKSIPAPPPRFSMELRSSAF